MKSLDPLLLQIKGIVSEAEIEAEFKDASQAISELEAKFADTEKRQVALIYALAYYSQTIHLNNKED